MHPKKEPRFPFRTTRRPSHAVAGQGFDAAVLSPRLPLPARGFLATPPLPCPQVFFGSTLPSHPFFSQVKYIPYWPACITVPPLHFGHVGFSESWNGTDVTVFFFEEDARSEK